MIKEACQKSYRFAERGVVWVHTEFQKSMARFSEDLRSMRILWIWLLLALWFWVVIWGMLYYPKFLGNTIVITLGGMVTIIINVYIFSKGHEKHLTNKLEIAKNGHSTPSGVKPDGTTGKVTGKPGSESGLESD